MLAGHRALVSRQRRFSFSHLARQSDDGAIRLELRDDDSRISRALPCRTCRSGSRPCCRWGEKLEFNGYVRRDASAATPVGPCLRSTARPHDLRRRSPAFARPVSWVYSPEVIATRPSPLNFSIFLEHDGAGGHVDAERQSLRREDDLHEFASVQLLDDFLERRQQTRVVRGDAALEVVQPLP